MDTARRCLRPSWWGVLLDVGYSAVLMGLLLGVLSSLGTVPAIPYLGGFFGSMFRIIRLVTG